MDFKVCAFVATQAISVKWDVYDSFVVCIAIWSFSAAHLSVLVASHTGLYQMDLFPCFMQFV
jgi:hypothetical protein